MQISWDEVRGWAAVALSYLAALITTGVFLWRAVVKKINAVAIALRKERDRELELLRAAGHGTALACSAHGQAITDHERRLIMAEGENKAGAAALVEIATHLRKIDRSIEDLRNEKHLVDIDVAGRLGALETGVALLLKQGLT